MKYEISEDGKSIKCLICGLTSYNPNDVENRYCANCNVFHDLKPVTYHAKGIPTKFKGETIIKRIG